MVTANPFRGLRYNPAVVGEVGAATAPPADTLTPQQLAAHTTASRYSIVQLLPDAHPSADSSSPAATLRAWLTRRVLTPDPSPALYVYEQTYPAGPTLRRQRGVLASVPLDRARSRILPHEATSPRLVEQRRRLLEALNLNISPIFALYAGGGRATAVTDKMTDPPPQHAHTDPGGVTHRLWVVTDPELTATWQATVEEVPLLIADGHHRYRAALAHQARARAAHRHQPAGPWDETLMFLVDADTDGPALGAVHRLLTHVTPQQLTRAAATWATAHPVHAATPHAAAAALTRALQQAPAGLPAFGLLSSGQACLLTGHTPATTPSGQPRLDVEVLHQDLLTPAAGVTNPDTQLAYEHDPDGAARHVTAAPATTAVLLRPATIGAVLHAARAGRTLPAKATRFHPKPHDGMVLRPLTLPTPDSPTQEP
jgi:uncharacterized protein (DUF1015 family)